MREERTIYIVAQKGKVRSARGIVAEALRDMLGDFYEGPFGAHYTSQGEAYAIERTINPLATKGLCRPSYTVQLTDSEVSWVTARISEIAKRKEWKFIRDGPLCVWGT